MSMMLLAEKAGRARPPGVVAEPGCQVSWPGESAPRRYMQRGEQASCFAPASWWNLIRPFACLSHLSVVSSTAGEN